MRRTKIARLPTAVRVYPETESAAPQKTKASKPLSRPDRYFVFDTETRTDATQRLIFGCYRYVQKNRCLEEGLFYADDICDDEYRLLKEYASAHNPDTVREGVQELLLLTRRAFVEKLFQAVYKDRCLLIGFNLPFDISRVACDAAPARGRFAGGFSLGLWTYTDKYGREQLDKFRPRIGIKKIDSKRALKGFTARKCPDRADLIPEDSPTGKPEPEFKFRGHFLDLRTLSFALTDRSYALETACNDFGVANGKVKTNAHGVVTDEYIDYNRRDTAATADLAFKLLQEYDRHPIALQATKAYSPASIGKAYLRAMGIQPILQRQPDFPKHLLGFAQSAFFGGRTSAHIRKCAAPVVYTDFLSMYPTVNILMGLWRFVIARRIQYVEHCTQETIHFLNNIQADGLFIQDSWRQLTAFVKVIPNGDILPNRAKYSSESNDWQVALNYVYADENNSAGLGLWFSLPDIVASVILTGRIPTIVDAFRIESEGVCQDLKPIGLRGEINVDPAEKDFFKTVIEERTAAKKNIVLDDVERERLEKALKVLANSTSYGIFAEMNAQESDEKVPVICHGGENDSYRCSVVHPDIPGEYCFPPLASLITGAARLMLALLERSVTQLGGTYVMEDTDSMAIVATQHGGIVRCPGGTNQTSAGEPGVKALSWTEVQAIVNRFDSLNPYDRAVVSDSVLKIESVNFDLNTDQQRQVYCFAISAKRYALFLLDEAGNPQLVQKGFNSKSDGWKEHGLGHLMSPTDPHREDRKWTAEVWLHMLKRSLGLSQSEVGFGTLPAIGRVTISSPAVMKAFRHFNIGKPYCDQSKPFNFLLTAQTIPFGQPVGSDPNRFHLIAPYETNPSRWLDLQWIDQYSGKGYNVTTDGLTGTRTTARLKTYADVLADYEYHPESKCADPNGDPCNKQTIGLLQRRHVQIDRIVPIGKESNRLEDVQSGMVQDEDSVYTEYPDPRRDEWETKIRPALKKMPIGELIAASGFSRRTLIEWRAGRSRPHPKNQMVLVRTIARHKRELQKIAQLGNRRGARG